MKFNTVTLHEVTNDFGELTHYRAVLNQGDHEYHVTDIVEAHEMKDLMSHVNKNWTFEKVIIGNKI